MAHDFTAMSEDISFYSKTFYKYRPVNEFTKDIFRNGTLWFSAPPKLNDPLDLRIPLDWNYSDENALDFLLSKYHPGLDSSEICAAIVLFQDEFSRPPSEQELMAWCLDDKKPRLAALVFRAQQLLESGVPRPHLVQALNLAQ